MTLTLLSGCVLGGSDKPKMEEDAGPDAGPRTEICVMETAEPLPATGVGRLAGHELPGILDGDRSCALFDDPVNVKLAPDGNLVVADFNNHYLRTVTPDGEVNTLTGQEGFFRPFGIVWMNDGTMIVETDWNTLGLQTPNNGAMWRVTATGEATLLAEDTGRLRGLVPLADGRLFATDYLNHYVGVFNPATGAFAPLAGVRATPGFVDATGAAARFSTPYDAVPLPGGDMLVADFGNHCLRRVTLTGVVSTYAGICGTSGYVDGPAATAQFNRPQGLAIDNAGNIFITDIDNFRVRQISPLGEVTTVAGTGVAGFADGPPLEAQFNGLEGIDVNPEGTILYVTDGDRGLGQPYHRIRRIVLTP